MVELKGHEGDVNVLQVLPTGELVSGGDDKVWPFFSIAVLRRYLYVTNGELISGRGDDLTIRPSACGTSFLGNASASSRVSKVECSSWPCCRTDR